TGDGVPDLLQLRDTTGDWYTVATYDGATGRLLWHDDRPNVALAVPLDRGGRRGGGVLLVQPNLTFTTPLVVQETLNLVALGPAGTTRWTQRLSGTLVRTPTGFVMDGYPYVEDLDSYLPNGRLALLTGQVSGELTAAFVAADGRG